MLSTQRYMQCVYAYICVHAHEHEHVHMSMCMCYILPHATCSRLTASAPPRVSVCRLLCHGPHHAALRLASPSMKHATMYGDNGSGGHKPGDSQLGAARSAPRRTRITNPYGRAAEWAARRAPLCRTGCMPTRTKGKRPLLCVRAGMPP